MQLSPLKHRSFSVQQKEIITEVQLVSITTGHGGIPSPLAASEIQPPYLCLGNVKEDRARDYKRQKIKKSAERLYLL